MLEVNFRLNYEFYIPHCKIKKEYPVIWKKIVSTINSEITTEMKLDLNEEYQWEANKVKTYLRYILYSDIVCNYLSILSEGYKAKYGYGINVDYIGEDSDIEVSREIASNIIWKPREEEDIINFLQEKGIEIIGVRYP
jgi:hypothetical protein